MKKCGVRRLASILLFTALTAQLASAAQEPSRPYLVFDSKRNAVTLQQIIDALDGADVLFIGETHDNPMAHRLEAELLRRVDEAYGLSSPKRRAVALSLEMFERDVQTVLDEYLAGLITERHFLLSSRPWRNYETDYKPLVEYARTHKLPVIAANAPARYVSRVSSQGPDALKSLPQIAIKSWLPPLPFPPASEAYAAKFNRFMGGAGAGPSAHGGLHLLAAQTLRDASMAYAISEYLKRGRDPLVVQVNGTFHSEERMGVPEHLVHYRSKTRAVVVTIVPAETFPDFDAASHARLGDFIIITDPAVKG